MVLIRWPALTFPRGKALFLSCAVAWLAVASSSADTLEIGTYNIEADIDGYTTPRPGLDSVIEAIGQQDVDNIEQPIDILALEETTSNAETVAPIVSDLNSYYGAGTYAMASYQATEQGGDPSEGNGPNAMIYNTTAVTLIATVGVTGTPSQTDGAFRQVVRYEFEPVGGSAANAFYVYVSHSKSSESGSSTQDQADRNTEAQLIRADEATLPAGSSVLYVGDFNLDGSSEAAYQTLTAAGPGQAVDPLNPTANAKENWSGSAYVNIATESATSLGYRDDLELMSQNVYNDTSAAGLDYITGTYRAFGNDGTTADGKSVDQSSNTALDNVAGGSAYQASILEDLTTASDHLPVVADFTVTVPEPTPLALLGCGIGVLALGLWRRKMLVRSTGR
jgi:endonuclease/exonuclease/phosphatase family metal-dependent hydrolase